MTSFASGVLRRASFLLALFCLAALPAPAQQPAPVGAGEREAVVQRIGELLVENYVFPDVAEASAQHIKTQLEAGAFDQAAEPAAFAGVLTEALQSVTHDKHLRVRIRPRDEAQEDPDAAQTRQLRRMRADNYGFERVEHLEGNVGYLDLRGFFPEDLARETAVGAMRFLANSDALIIDLRQNGGGSPATVRLICSYFFDRPTHLNSLYWRRGDRTEEFWTLDEVEGTRMPDVPLYVLTSSFTFSGAEEFAYNMKTQQRATLVGETTGGGANPGGFFPINDRFGMFVPTGRAINPVTGTNWEGAGVEPDVKVSADAAYDAALAMAREAAEKHRAVREAGERAQREALKTELDRAVERFAQGKSKEATAAVHAAMEKGVSSGLLGEMSINMMGYRYLRDGDTKMAIALFAFNVHTYPESSNVYDSLGEAYMEDGQREQAVANYKKSLELDPGNENAVRMLEKLNVGGTGR